VDRRKIEMAISLTKIDFAIADVLERVTDAKGRAREAYGKAQERLREAEEMLATLPAHIQGEWREKIDTKRRILGYIEKWLYPGGGQ
jgi:hypothetical protein